MINPVPAEIDSASLQRKKQETPPKHPTFWKNAREYFSDYTNTTTLNGFRYLGERNRSTFEKILWLAILGVSLGMCSLMILDTYRKWDNTPVIISFVPNPMPVWEIPFPAITICPETKFRRSFHNFTKYYNQYHDHKNLSDLELKHLSYSCILCGAPMDQYLTDENFFQFIDKGALSKDELIFGCRFLGNEVENCKPMFSTILTDEGICYSINIMRRDDIYTSEVYHSIDFLNNPNKVTDWSNEKGYAKSAGKNTYPIRLMSAGAESGVILYLTMHNENIDYVCKGANDKGYKLILHNPVEVPQARMQYLKVPLGADVTLAIKPDVIKTSNSLRNYDPRKKRCYFANEKQLRYYKNYTQQNCLLECLSNYTLKKCDCVSFYMPRQNTTRICGAGSSYCTTEAQREVIAANAVREEFNKSVADVACDCLPSCTSIIYNAETSQARYEWEKFGNIWFLDEAKSMSISRVSIFFKEMQFITSERNELYGVTDFVANCGGLLGLFIGFSLISLLEILYYLTVRLGINLKNYGRHYWSGSENLLQRPT